MKRTFLAISLLSVSAAHAASEPVPSAAGSIVQMLIGLGIVLVALFAGLTLLRKLQKVQPGMASALKVLGATSVGTRERVVLVSVGKQVLVLGVAPGRVTALHTLNAEDLPAPTQPEVGLDFANRLKGLMERRRGS